jgi:dTDP-4-dehydrorhamnose 3,5-epimerase-like enzyme
MLSVRVDNLTLRTLNKHDNGELVAVEAGKDLPFTIQRNFTIRSPGGTMRGKHAHKHCAQFMICQLGTVEVTCDDGKKQKLFVLDNFDVGLLVPPGIWATERFLGSQCILNVLCDQRYDEDDYIRNYNDFLIWKKAN